MLPILKSWVDRYFHNEEAVLVLALVACFGVIVWVLGNDIGPLWVALVIAFLMQGLVLWLKEKGVSHIIAVTIALLLLIGVMVSTLIFLIPVVWNQAGRLVAELPLMLTQGRELLLRLPELYPSFVTAQQVEDLIRHLSNELAGIGQGLLSFSLSNIPVLFLVLIYMVMVPLLVFFFLKDGRAMLSWGGSFLPRERPVMTTIWNEMNQQIANYVRGKVIEIILVGATAYLAFLILGLKFALLLGIAVGLSVVIPYIGAVVVTLPVLAIGFFQWGFDSQFLYLTIVYLVIQGIDGNVLVPLLFSEAVKLHPVAIILAVLVFGGLWGFWGVFFAIPLATFVKAIINAWPRPIYEDESELSDQGGESEFL